MRDSELTPSRSLSGRKLLMGGTAGALLLTGLAAWWLMSRPPAPLQLAASAGSRQPQDVPPAAAPPQAPPELAAQLPVVAQPDNAPLPGGETKPATALAAPPQPAAAAPAPGNASLFEQRLAAGKQLLEQKKAVASIQLFYSEEIKQERIENFLRRADRLGKLSEIYLLPASFGSKDGLRVLYGTYSSTDEALNAVSELPQRYQEAFTTSVYTF